VPTLLLYGDADHRSPLEVVARDLHAKIPGSALVVLSGVGHQCDMEAPERFNAEVRGFLRSVPAKPPSCLLRARQLGWRAPGRGRPESVTTARLVGTSRAAASHSSAGGRS
jgi:hypothetical protein